MAAKGWPCHFMDNLHIFVDKCNFILGGHKTGIWGGFFPKKRIPYSVLGAKTYFTRVGRSDFGFSHLILETFSKNWKL